MKTARKKFLITAMLAVFILLTVLLAIINGVSYSMATADADVLTQMIAMDHGRFSRQDERLEMQPADEEESSQAAETEAAPAALQAGPDAARAFSPFGKPGPMGPSSPEIHDSLRFFTVAFDSGGNAQIIALNISAVNGEEAVSWAESLKNETTGWSRWTYRYRVYEWEDRTYVTVIDQGREILPSFRILMISVIGGLAGLITAFLVLLYVSRKLFRPLEDADRKQKQFIAEAEREFKVPLTVISADTELIEREHGTTEETQSINRQVRKMKNLVTRLGALAIFEDQDQAVSTNLSRLISEMAESTAADFAAAGISLTTDTGKNIQVQGEEGMYRRILAELIANALKFSKSEAGFTLQKEKDRVILRASGDADLPDGEVSQVFDRFVRLENAEGKEGPGLGLSYVREWVQSLAGRVDAKVENGIFCVKISL